MVRRGRRPFLLRGAAQLIALTLTGCASPQSAIQDPPPPPPPDREVEDIADLLTAVGLEWVIDLAPQRIAETPWLEPALARVLHDDRLDALAVATGIDVRAVPRLVIAGYEGADETIAYFVRHRADRSFVERKFRARLTGDVERRRWDHQLETVWGHIGRAPRGYVGVGPSVAGFQYGGSPTKGPMRIAVLYERGDLEGIPSLFRDETLGATHRALGEAPAKMILAGPFPGELERGARGLLAAAFALGVAVSPTARRELATTIILVGDFGRGRERRRAADFARLAWEDLARSDLGHLLGLSEPVDPAKARPHPLGIVLEVSLEPTALFEGLAAATMDDIATILR